MKHYIMWSTLKDRIEELINIMNSLTYLYLRASEKAKKADYADLCYEAVQVFTRWEELHLVADNVFVTSGVHGLLKEGDDEMEQVLKLHDSGAIIRFSTEDDMNFIMRWDCEIYATPEELEKETTISNDPRYK